MIKADASIHGEIHPAGAVKGAVQPAARIDGDIRQKLLKGDKGDSAYEVAVEHGFVGTEEEWLASLIGPEGQQGIQGIPGIPGEKGDPGDDYVLTEADKEEIASLATVKDVKINSVSILDEGVANIQIASKDVLGVVKVRPAYGIKIDNSGTLSLAQASEEMAKNGVTALNALTPSIQHKSTFYGLAKAAGHDEKDSSNPVGTYTEEAKTAIRNMLDVPSVDDIPEAPVQDVQINGTSILDEGVANIPLASNTNHGLVKYGAGLMLDGSFLTIFKASNNQIKAGTASYSPIVPNNQHRSVFYGLAVASGDTTQSVSSNPVGTYTDEAKTAIKAMLGLSNQEIVDIVEAGLPSAEEVSW